MDAPAQLRSCAEGETSRRLAAIPGLGVITATAIAATVSDPGQFRSGPAFPHVALQSGATLSEAMKEMIQEYDPLLSAAYEPPVMALDLVDKAVDREVALNPFAPVLAKPQTQFGVFDQPADCLLQRFRVLRRHE